MQLLRLRLQNFRQHRNTDLSLGAGLIGIVGPNGSGKSTLLEAVAYALYGVAATRGTRDTLRRRRAEARERMEVELTFQFGPHEYRIVRSLTAAELLQDGVVIANSTGAVTDRMTALFRMTRDAFFNTYFTGQKELAVMAAMGPTERGQFLSRLLGYEKLRDAQDLLREQRSALRSELAGLEQGLVDPGALEAELATASAAVETARAERDLAHAAERQGAERVAALRPFWVAAQERRTAWQALDGERRVVEARVAAARVGFQSLDRELALALRARERLTAIGEAMTEWNTLHAERELLDRAATAYTARSRSAARRELALRRAGELEPQLLALADVERVTVLSAEHTVALNAREAVDRQLAERRMRWTQDVQEARTRLEGLRERYRELQEQRGVIEQQGPEGICPTCGRPLGKDYLSLVELLGRQMEEVTTDGNYFRQRVEQLGSAPADVAELDRERERLEQEGRRVTEALGQARAQRAQRQLIETERTALAAELRRLDAELTGPAANYDAARHESVRLRLAQLEPLRREHDQLTGLAQRAEALVADAAAAEQRASAAEGELILLDQRIATVQWDAVAFATAESNVRDAETTLQAARVAVARATAAVEGVERLRESALVRQADRAAKAEIARHLGMRIGVLEELDSAFSALRTDLNLKMRPELADHASRLLQDLTSGRYDDLDLSEGYVPVLVEDGEAKPVISGGEEDVVNLALRLAISQMIAERAGQPLSVLILDEIFGSLDEERRSAVLELLRALADRFPQVILITHVEGMQHAFDRVLRVSYDNGTGASTVRDETPEPADVAA